MKKALANRLKDAAIALTAVVVTSCAALTPALMGGMSGVLANAHSTGKLAQKQPKAQAKPKKAAGQAAKDVADSRQTTQSEISVRPLSYEDSLRYQYFFLEALRQQNAGHYDAAYDLLAHSLDINPQAAEGWYFMSMYQSELGRDSLSRECMERAAALSPDNDAYQERLAQYYLNTREYDKATAVYERLADNNRQRTDVLQMLIRLYNNAHDYDGMLRAISRIEDVEGSREEITLAKMRVHEMKGDKKAALKALKSLSDEHPSDVNYRVMMGNWLMQNGRQKDAFKIFTAALREEPENAYVQSSMYDYYRAAGQDSLAREMMRAIILSPKATSESKSTMMRQAIQENEQSSGDSTEILRLYDEMLVVNPKDSDMAEMKVAYMSLKQMPTDSINRAIRTLLAIAPENAGARMQLLGSYITAEEWDSVVSICRQGTQYNPDEMVFYYYEGLAYYQQQRRDDALDAFSRGVAQVNARSNKEMVADLYYFMGDLQHQRNHEREAFAAYDSCLQWQPDHIHCLNNYAYYLSVRGEDLHRAELMSYKTVKEEPQNATFLDTYAWILFVQERYAEAKIYAEQAVACDTDSVRSSVIVEHAGDVSIMLGERDKAVDYWQQALLLDCEHPDLIEQKIREKKYIKPEEDE